jgi:hypothetical protein
MKNDENNNEDNDNNNNDDINIDDHDTDHKTHSISTHSAASSTYDHMNDIMNHMNINEIQIYLFLFILVHLLISTMKKQPSTQLTSLLSDTRSKLNYTT